MKDISEVKEEVIRLFWRINKYKQEDWKFARCRGAIEALCWAYELPLGEDNFYEVLTDKE